MKTFVTPLVVFCLWLCSADLQAQYYNQGGWGRRGRTAIPQAQTPPPEPEKLTAAEYVEKEMPRLIEVMGLDPFEEAVVRSVLVTSVQKRMELQILGLEPTKMKEEYEKILNEQNEGLKNGLPEEKYNIYLEMQDNPSKTERKQKKKKKKKKSKS